MPAPFTLRWSVRMWLACCIFPLELFGFAVAELVQGTWSIPWWLAALAGAWLIRAALVSVKLSPEGIFIRNFLTTRQLPWAEVRRIEGAVATLFPFKNGIGAAGVVSTRPHRKRLLQKYRSSPFFPNFGNPPESEGRRYVIMASAGQPRYKQEELVASTQAWARNGYFESRLQERDLTFYIDIADSIEEHRQKREERRARRGGERYWYRG